VKPLIGIPQCLDESERIRRGRAYFYIDVAYARAVERAGGVPVHLPVQRAFSELLGRIDGLLLPGGDDFLPDAPYPSDVRFDPAPATQIEFDRALLTGALERGIPTLGICYGAQLLALHHGGTLHHHLPLDRPDSSQHQLGADVATHEIRIEPDSRLAQHLGQTEISVNSLHHQAVDAPGSGMRVSARAHDGVVEAIERESDGFCMGVQWHPEKLPAESSDALFRAFVGACREG
jgi:putative glutamine amidotransferase